MGKNPEFHPSNVLVAEILPDSDVQVPEAPLPKDYVSEMNDRRDAHDVLDRSKLDANASLFVTGDNSTHKVVWKSDDVVVCAAALTFPFKQNLWEQL